VFRDRDRRLHRSMREVRSVILSLDDLAALGKFRVDIANVANDFTRLPSRGFEGLTELIGVVNRVGTRVPVDLQSLAPLERSPGVVGNHGDSAERLKLVWWFERADGKRLLHAGYGEGFLIVV